MAVTQTEEQFATVGEIELAYETFGRPGDPAVLLIMGLGAQMIFWPEELCERLAQAGQNQAPQRRLGSATPHFVIRFDNRDAGRSTVLDYYGPPDVRRVAAGELEAPYLLQHMADDAVGLLDHLGIERAHVAGASLGGMIAQRVAIDHPERVLTLASIMSTTGDRGVGHPTPEAMAVLMSAPPTDRDGYVESTLAARAVIGSKPPDEIRTRELAERSFDRGYHPEGTARQLAAVMASPDRAPELREIAAPTVVIHGSDDALIGVSGGEATAAAIPGAELVVIDGMGHDLPPRFLDPIVAALTANFARATPPGA
jgi:pimeloyl-ACP methyl ester carboxylesterase